MPQSSEKIPKKKQLVYAYMWKNDEKGGRYFFNDKTEVFCINLFLFFCSHIIFSCHVFFPKKTHILIVIGHVDISILYDIHIHIHIHTYILCFYYMIYMYMYMYMYICLSCICISHHAADIYMIYIYIYRYTHVVHHKPCGKPGICI